MKHRTASRKDQIIPELLSYWIKIKGNRAMPARKDLVPAAIKSLLSHVQLIDVEGSGQRFRHRLVGTHLVEIFGAEFTNRYLDEILEGDRYESMARLYREVCETKLPLFVRNHYRTGTGLQFVTDRIYLPFSQNQDDVDLIGCAITFDSPFSIAGEWRSAAFENHILEKRSIHSVEDLD